jgi:hypothetical protein
MPTELQLSSRSAAALMAQIFGPAVYEIPGRGVGPVRPRYRDFLDGTLADSWQSVSLNPRPLPPREAYALALADAHIHELIRLDRLGTLLGGDVERRAIEQALRTMAEIVECCPRWPAWPTGWSIPPNPDPQSTMRPDDLFVFGSLMLSAAELIEQPALRDAVATLGEHVLGLSMELEAAA